MKTKQRGFIVPLLIVIIALLLAGGAYVYTQQKQNNQPETAQISDWKKYESPDKKIAFEYSHDWLINEQSWKDGVLGILMGQPAEIPSSITIEEVEKNAVTMEERIQTIKKDGAVENDISLNGSKAIRLEQNNAIFLFIDKGDYYIVVNAEKFGIPSFDIPTEHLLSTILVR